MTNKSEIDIYSPYRKNDFRELWYNTDTNVIEPFKIIRKLTIDEKKDFSPEYDYSEEMYLIRNNSGKEYEVFDTEILKECELSLRDWHNALIKIIDDMEYNEETMKEFIEYCKIKKWIKRNY